VSGIREGGGEVLHRGRDRCLSHGACARLRRTSASRARWQFELFPRGSLLRDPGRIARSGYALRRP
jgi:hypothetical protein